jgi:hypothetical protein
VKTKLSFLLFVCLIFFGCKKEKYISKPQLKLKKINVFQFSCESSLGSAIEMDLEVTDKEGDVKDSIFIQKIDAASIPCPDNSLLNLDYNIPDYPTGNTQNVLFRLKFSTIQCQNFALIGGSQCLPRKDTSYFKIWVKDLAGNQSDTLRTPSIAIP